MGKAIVITGTPGVGKTSIALELAKRLKAKYINLGEVALNKNMILKKDEERDTYVIDENMLRRSIELEISKTNGLIVIDSHFGEIINDDLVELVFVLRLNPLKLFERLISRGYTKSKAKENIEAELLGVCTYNALSAHPNKVCEIDATGKNIRKVLVEIIDIIRGKKPCNVHIDWLSKPFTEAILKLITS